MEKQTTKKTLLTPEEKHARKLAAQRRYDAKKKAEKEARDNAIVANKKSLEDELKKANETIVLLNNKINELEKICRAYTEKENNIRLSAQKALTDRNIKMNYMLEVAKHAYLAMKFAINSTDKEEQH